MKRTTGALSALFVTLLAPAQESPLLSSFTLTDLPGAVRLDWTMTAGSTCVGTDILRSEDSLHFEVVGGISEVCGQLDQPTSYDHTDNGAPEFRTLFYRLRLGLNGYSSIQRIDHVRSRTKEIHLHPVPASGELTVVLNAGADTEASVEVFAADGRSVYAFSGLSGAVHRLDVGALPSGGYILRAAWGERTAFARFVVR